MKKEWTTDEIRELYQSFFESKGHARIPSAPLVPDNDPSVLFTTAGMHPLVPYLKGQPHPLGKRLTNVQKCLRTTDIDGVGDATHATVFEMLGNWSLGDYFKEEAITWSWEFLTSDAWLGIDPKYLAVSVFAGDDNTPRDEESAALWKRVGIPATRIAYLGNHDNWWPAGGGQPGPQGPDTEMFFWTGAEDPPEHFDPQNSHWVEIWNDVFMEYNRTADGVLEPLPQKNVDTGMGLERTVMILNGLKSIYEVDSFQELMTLINQHSTKDGLRHKRILADHIKAATFILGDEQPVVPGKQGQGYVLRRLIRRAMLAARELGIRQSMSELLSLGAELIVTQYKQLYSSLEHTKGHIFAEFTREVERFSLTLERGLLKIDQIFQNRDDINGQQAFELYATYGFPIELQEEEAKKHGKKVDIAGFENEMKKHKELSRTAATGKFKGGLADRSEKSIHYHTATHLLHQALRTILGNHVLQRGSNITPERLRFDFSRPAKMTAEQIKRVEDLVNKKIKDDLPVTRSEMTVAEAKEQGALGLFEHKYGDKVSVYVIGDFSREICGGPHVHSTGKLGRFRIVKEESAGAGIRRIKAILE